MTFLHGYDRKLAKLKSAIYKERKVNHLTYSEIGELHSIPSSRVKELYTQAKALRTNGNYSWLEGLSNRAINQIRKTDYVDFFTLCGDVLNDEIDLEDLHWVGRKVAIEVRRWCRGKLRALELENLSEE